MSRLGISTPVAAAAIIVALVVVGFIGYQIGVMNVQTVVTTEFRTVIETMKETVEITKMETATMGVTRTETVTMMAESIPSVVIVPNQIVTQDSIVIKAVYLDKPGYVAIHIVTLEDKPGPVVGHSGLLKEGITTDLRIVLDNYKGRGELIAMLHYDDGDGVYNFPGPDKPVVANGAIVQSIFKITNTEPSIAVSDQEVKNGVVVIDGLFLDKPGYVAIHKVTPEGGPGPVIGHSSLLVGQLVKIPVPIQGYAGEEELIAMLHYDDGDGEYNFPGPDVPVKIGDEIVLVRFKVGVGQAMY